jgi:selenocysteine lyase/cysteine desulfurase
MNTLWDNVRKSIIGEHTPISTPFGTRIITYADYNASGRGLDFIENYLKSLLKLYSNTHTEDDATGRITTERLHQAETTIKKLVGAGKEYRIIEVGTGTTGAIHRLQQILGIYIPPAAKQVLTHQLNEHLGETKARELTEYLLAHRPVVFVGPYEHHSNEVSWRECFVDVVEIELTDQGYLDLDDLRSKVSDDKYADRKKIGSFSAASNVTGLKTPVYEVARILHEHDALAFFDFAAAASYVEIDMCKDDTAYFDGIFFSPHKFLGGPGSCGILIIHEDVYPRNLPPVVGAGGTVDFVNAYAHIYNPNIEVREKPGTPGIMQILKAALALELKELMNPVEIEKREQAILTTVLDKLADTSAIELVVPMDPEHNLPIVSFNISAGESYLHPRFVVRLLNDLFGIQARAGCSCAGPYGHKLLHIDRQTSERYRKLIREGNMGIKPGWTRISFHFIMTDEEIDFLCKAVRFVAEYGRYFLPLYQFDIHTGNWEHREFRSAEEPFGIEQALAFAGDRQARPAGAEPSETNATGTEDLSALYNAYLDKAYEMGAKLKQQYTDVPYKSTERDLISFLYY